MFYPVAGVSCAVAVSHASSTAATVVSGATAAAQLQVHVSQLVAELAAGDAVQEEVDGVIGVHQLEANSAK